MKRFLIGLGGVFAVLVVLAGALVVWQLYLFRARPVTVTTGQFPEELVYARSSDDVVNGGAMFRAAKDNARPIAVVWMHGWGVNFYSPTYVNVGRRLAERGFTTIAINTRMHDIGSVETERFGKQIRGGGYWGVPSEEIGDIAAWVDFAAGQGFGRVVLVGHSAGWATVRAYQAEKQDQRIVGLVLASGQARALSSETDPNVLAQATKLAAGGLGDDLVRLPNRSFPSYVSAATYLDIAKTQPDMLDFFGERTANPGVTRIQCPILAFFGTRGDVGNEDDLKILKSSVERQPRHPTVTVELIRGADHMYTGEEEQVAQVIATWADGIPTDR